MQSGMMLPVCFGLTQLTYLLAILLTIKMEKLSQERFVIGMSRGIVQRLPQHTGLMQVILLLLCCVPGSAFFFIEDMAIEGLLDHSWLAVCIVLFCNTLMAIGLWGAFTDIFLGRHTTEQSSSSESGLFPYRAAIGLVVGLSLMPFLWAV